MTSLITILIASVIQAPPLNLEFKRFTPADGFPMVAISGLTQDGDGNIWISNSENGAVYKFNGFTIDKIQAINAGRIFVSSRNEIYYIEAGQVTRISGDKKTVIPLKPTAQQWKYKIAELSDGNLFIAAPDANYRYNPDTGILSLADDIGIYEYISAVATSGENLYLATDKGKIYRKGKDSPPTLIHTADDKVTNLLPTRDDRLLVGTPSHGLWVIDTVPDGDKEFILDGNCTCVCLGSGNDLWIGTNTGMYIYDMEGRILRKIRRNDTDPSSLPHYSVRHIMMDNQGGIWIGTQYGGVCYWNPGRSHVTRLSSGTDQFHLSNPVASQILEIEDGRILIGTNNGLNAYNPATSIIKHYLLSSEDGYDDVKSILPIGKDRFLIGYYKSGLQLFNMNNGSFIHLNSPRSVYRILPDGDGTFLIGTEEMLHRYNLPSNTYSRLNRRSAMILQRDSKGRIWQGGNNSISLSDSVILEIPAVKCMLETRSGAFLIGSDNGLFRFEDGWKGPEKQRIQGLPDEAAINGMEQDDNGRIWIGTTNGLYTIGEDNVECLRFSTADGLATDYMYNYSHRKLRNGNLCFGGIGGVSIFDPGKMTESGSGCPAPVISSIKVHGDSFIPANRNGKITFKHSQNNIRFTFSVPDYIAQGSNLFRYRLYGFDSRWYDCGNDRTANYSNLPKGHYKLMVECSRNGKFWTPMKQPLDFKVKPVWFLSTLAVILEILLLLSCVAAVFIITIKRKELKAALEMKSLEDKHAQELGRLKALKFINASPRGATGSGKVIKEINKADERFLTKAISIVENNISNEKFNIDELASRMNISRMKLYTEMKRITGGSASDLIHKVRFTEACRLLVETDKTASEIAYDTGFSSPVYFSESFKKNFGCTPKDYARINKK